MANPDKQAKGRDSKGRFLKGKSGNPEGATVGSKRPGIQVKLAFFKTFADLGDHKTLTEWAKRNKKDFYRMVALLTPKEIDMKAEGMAETKIVIIRSTEKAKTSNRIEQAEEINV